jgi:hypothetical protein
MKIVYSHQKMVCVPHGNPGSYEWWYLDAHLDDGSTLVTAFHTKPTQDIDAPLSPYMSIMLDRPDGTHIERRIRVSPGDFSASTETTDIRMGPNTFRKDPIEWMPKNEAVGMYGYDLMVEDEELLIEMGLNACMPMWRPRTGHFLFDESKYFAWVVPVPYGDVQGHMVLGGRKQYFHGTGYHDHNWGNTPIGQLMRGWEWSRGRAGRCAVLAAQLYPQEEYGGGELPIFMLAQNGNLITDRLRDVDSFTTSNGPVTTRHYEYPRFGHDEAHGITFRSEQSLAERSLARNLGDTGLSTELDAGSLYRRFSGTMKHTVLAVGTATTEHLLLRYQ